MPELPEVMSRQVLTRSILWSVLLIVFGFIAIASPIASSIGAALVIGWLVLISGLVQFVHAFQSKGIGHIVWKLVVAVFYFATGVYLISHPVLGLAGLTLVTRHILLRDRRRGYHRVVLHSKERRLGWMLLNGIITLVLGFMIWNRWPATSLWFLGTLVGISLLYGRNVSAHDGPDGPQAP